MLLFWVYFALHPIYISVTELVFKNDELQVMHKVFIDDLEKVIEAESGTKMFLFEKNENPKAKDLVCAYFEKKVVLTQKNQKLKLKFVGFEKEDDALWVYFETQTNIPKGTALSLENNIFIAQIPEQINIVYIKNEAEKRSFKLGASKQSIDFLR